MKPYHLFLLIAVVAISCQKDDDLPEDIGPGGGTLNLPGSILAGQDSALGIIYVDLDPDSMLLTGPYHFDDSVALDLNMDGTVDFIIHYHISDPFMLGSVTNHLEIRPQGDNQVAVNSSEPEYVDSLSYHALIDDNLTWSGDTSILFHYAWSQSGYSHTDGYFRYNGPYYMGLKVMAGGNSYYGWLYMDHLAIDKYAITKEY